MTWFIAIVVLWLAYCAGHWRGHGKGYERACLDIVIKRKELQ